MKKIAILTSGGDSQGMNTAVRAVAKTAMTKGIEVYGIRRGYKGLYEERQHLMEVELQIREGQFCYQPDCLNLKTRK